MKRLIFILSFLTLAGYSSFAKTLTMATVKKAAVNYLVSVGLPGVTSEADLSLVYTGTGTYNGAKYTSLYVLAVNGGKGWIMLSADDLAKPVLAWSSTSSFDVKNMAPATLAWIHNYENQVARAIRYGTPAKPTIPAEWQELLTAPKHAAAKTTAVAPLCATTWNQSPYYNDLCPYDIPAAHNTITGCVATAMAQVMKYWNWPKVGCGMHSYNDPGYGTLTANFGTTAYDWAAMPNSLSGPNTAVATLMSHAGISVDMYYGPGGSNAMVNSYQNFITPCSEFALKANFHYKKTLHSLYRTGEVPGFSPGVGPDSVTETVWVADLKADLDAGHPIIYCGFASIVVGHCWVLDGYTVGDMFHFNWGWGGSSDGYYTVDNLAPPAMGGAIFDLNQTVILGIVPDSFPSTPGNIKLLSPLNTSRTPLQFGQPFSVSAKIMNSGTSTYFGDFCAQVYDTANTFKGTVQTYLSQVILAGDSTSTLNFSTTGMFNMVSGIYSMRIYHRPIGTGTWIPVANNNNFINSTNIAVYNDSDMEIVKPIVTSPGLIFTRYAPLSVTTSIADVSCANGGNNYYWPHNNFTGNVRATLNKVSDGSIAYTIQTFTGVSIDTNVSMPFTFSTASLTAPVGTYVLEISHQYNGVGNYYLTGSTYFCNPIVVMVASALDQENLPQLVGINVYPNPATNELTITAPYKVTTVSISNMVGQAMGTYQYDKEQVQVDVSGLPAGVYLVKVNDSEVRKFVKE
jgi:Peptidase C10 family/Secretion system C-terminal sorting domain/Spi protease inhibitor